MSKKLLIVESPTKAKTLKGYLGRGFNVLASKGHIKDLPKSRMGIDLEGDFEPHYIVLRDKRQLVKKIQEEAKKADIVFLGSDPDREGEAIAQHIKEEIEKKVTNVPIKRVLFYEITPEEVKNSIKNPGDININLVNAQKARRTLDRIVGYTISPLLWKAIAKGLSAGRVQTVALRLICEREEKIEKFQKATYYIIQATFEKNGVKFEAIFQPKKRIEDKKEIEKILEDIKDARFKVKSYVKKEKYVVPPPPYKTSTLQQDASRILGFPPRKTMQLAQKLYEGVPVNGRQKGLITYMRTDSLRLSDKAVRKIRDYLKKEYGTDYVPQKAREFKDKSKSVQGAHEAIRPTDMNLSPEVLRGKIDAELLKLYELIWKRAVASQAKSARVEERSVIIIPETREDIEFTGKGSRVVFNGFYKVLEKMPEKVILPDFDIGEIVNKLSLKVIEKHTEPPPRYTDATLIKTLEQLGVGRPSTYAPTISTLIERKYVIRRKKTLYPTELGRLVKDVVVPRFPELFDVHFTARMEEELDEIENGNIEWKTVVKAFYEKLKVKLEEFKASINDIKQKDATKELDEKCPLCGAPLVVRWGRYGKFIACSRYPECKYTRPLNEPEKTGVKCPVCGGDLIKRRNRKGQTFYACSNYPECKFTMSHEPVAIKCPACGFPVLEKIKGKNGVYYRCPECKKTFSEEEIEKNKKK